ncbi:MAG: GumC family protein, partial [bacterium]
MPVEEDSYQIINYFLIFSRRKKQLLIPVVIMVSLSVIFTMMLPKIYKARARILSEERGINPVKGLFSPASFNQRRFNIMVGVIKSRPKIEEIIKKLRLEQNIKGPKEYKALTDSIIKGLSIGHIDNIITVSFMGQDPRLCMQIVNVVCGFFIDQDINIMYGSSFSTYPVLKQLLDFYSQKVNKSRSVLAKFRLDNKGLLPKTINDSFKKVEKIQLAIGNTKVRTEELYAQKESLERKLAQKEENTEYQQKKRKLSPLEKKLQKLNDKLKKLMTRYTKRHPEV